MSNEPIRILLVDDSAVVRGLMARAIETDLELKLVGTAMHGQAALNQLRKQPIDVVVTDVEMPIMDGLALLQEIQQSFPDVHVIMASSLTFEGGETTVKALAMGAAGCVAKPQGKNATESIASVSRELVPLIKALKRRHIRTNDRSSTSSAAKPAIPPTPVITARPRRAAMFPPQLVVIGTSTGGPRALQVVLKGLPTDFPLPILIVQHMPATFTPMLARHIQLDTGRPSIEGRHGEAIKPGHTYVAPGDYHMEISRDQTRTITLLHQGPQEHFCRPSVNPLFRSAAKAYGERVLAVMLTGMGEDGIEGTRDLFTAGANIIAQDEATSVVWGMPGAVVKAQLAHHVLPLDQIAPAIMRHCLQEARR